MPSEAEIEADKMCPHCRGTGQPNGIMGGPEHGLCSWCKGTGRAAPDDISFYRALSAASAVRSEPVAWRVGNAADGFDYYGPRQRATAEAMAKSSGQPCTPLYTSPVQTREDGIREAAKIAAERWRELDAQLAGGKILEHLQERVTGRAFEAQALEASILSLLSQPEPKP